MAPSCSRMSASRSSVPSNEVGLVEGRCVRISFNDRRNLAFGKAELLEDLGHLAGGIGDMVPRGQRGGVFRAMADEDAEIVQPGGGMKDVVIVGLTLGQAFGELVKPGLVAELVRRLRLGADVGLDGLAVTGFRH